MNEQYYDDVEYQLARNTALFRALADSERQQIIMTLARKERVSVGELTLFTQLSRPAVSHHIKILKDAGLLFVEKEGVKRFYIPAFKEGILSMMELIATIKRKEEVL